MKTFRQITRDLAQVYPEGEARALARWLCEERFGLTQTDLLLGKDNELSADNIAAVKEITSRLVNHEPIQYILGTTDFCGHRFRVAPGALIPRPETQQLVGHVVGAAESIATDSATKNEYTPSSLRILDVGTGTGCIALSLALALPRTEVTAWDVSEEALAVARQNLALYPDARVTMEQADILSPPDDDRLWDIIVSNPPYVLESEKKDMQRNVLDHEPYRALFVPDSDPLLFYRAIARYAVGHLATGGQLWVEINHNMAKKTALLIEEFGFSGVEIFEDTFGKPRFVKGVKQV